MDISIVVILIFLALVFGTLCIALLVSDLAGARVRGAGSEQPALQLQSEPGPVQDGLAGRCDFLLQQLMEQTGLGIGPWTAFLTMMLCGLLVGAVALLWTDRVAAAMGLGLIGMLLPLGFFVYKRYERFQLMDKQLPGLLDLMTRAVRAGQSIDEAFKLAGQSGQKPTGREFERVATQLEMGLSMSAAMKTFIRRVPLQEVRILGSALRVQRQTGGNIAQVMSRVATIIRDRQSYRHSFRATTAGARMALGLVGLCVPAYLLFMLFGQPEYGSQFFAHPHGLGMFMGAAALLLCGAVWIGMTLKSEY